ncbi:MAG: amino acid adenylation domain-containing protein [Deltaproteobacteria bacterium]|nr:amino acid adenylation domain-containing protein [Deltaproteobacteria bacterium]
MRRGRLPRAGMVHGGLIPVSRIFGVLCLSIFVDHIGEQFFLRLRTLMTMMKLQGQQPQHGQPFSCVIIGDTSLPAHCAGILVRAGHTVKAVISDTPEFRQWAHDHNVPVYHSQEDWGAQLSPQSFTYLFSIINQRILSAALLSLPSHAAINFHDGPLPRFAGMYAPAWALLRRETEHGVTWHVMTGEVDAGDILKQRRFSLAPDETSLSLNLKCYEAAIASFQELVTELADQRWSPIPQDLSLRTYFAEHERPPGGGIISWNTPAADLAGVCRALSFGPYLNPLTTLKFHVNGDFFIVTEYELRPGSPSVAAGTIRAMQQDSLTIATATEDFTITKLLTVDGDAVPVASLSQQYGLQIGQQLPDLARTTLNELTQQASHTAKHEGFWRKRLTSIHPARLPYVSSPMNERTGSASLPVSFSLPVGAHTVPPQPWRRDTLILTAFAVYLSRLTQEHSFDIGFTSASQRAEEHHTTPLSEKLFAVRVPFRVQLDLDGPFTQAYTTIAQEVTLCEHHRTYTRDLLVRDPAIHEIPRVRHVADVSVVFLPCVDEDPCYAQGAITLHVSPDVFSLDTSAAEPMSATIVYNTRVLDEPTILRMVGHLQTLLTAAVANPEQPLSALPLLTASERQQILFDWNDTTRDYPQTQCLQQLFATQVERTPDAVAVVCAEEHVPYRVLNARANRLAHYLQKKGVQRETLVGVCLERSLDMTVALLAILKAGGAYVLLDPHYPTERLRFMLEDTAVSIILTQEKFFPLFSNAEAAEVGSTGNPTPHPLCDAQQLVCLDTEWDTINKERVDNPACVTTADDCAYVMYTSGSTGRPKGVAVPHRGITRLLFGVDYVQLDTQQKLLHLAPISFDASTFEIWGALLHGGTCVLYPAQVPSPHELGALVKRHGVTTLWLTASLFNTVIGTEPGALSGVRQLLIGGEALSVAHVRRALALLPTTRITNGYGPTESTTFACCYHIPRQLAANLTSVPIGTPISNTTVYILDQYLSPLPVGVPGELYIGGDGLACGYLHRPEQSAEKFIPDPFSSRPGARLYRTGDMVRYLPDGNIEFLGRRDTQVKIRGYRIELGEIEATLQTHPAVQSAVVLAREDVPEDKQLIAYIVGHHGSSPPLSALCAFLRTTLPDYMLPVAFVVVERIPLTPNGKVDRNALPHGERA